MEKWIQHPLIKPEQIESRLYQQVLAAEALKKGNTMIVAPTALGKTIVAALMAAERLKKFPSSKILMLAPSKPLAVQHEESLHKFLKAPVTVLTGSITPDKRINLWEKAGVISATPQTIESDLIAGRYNLNDVSLLIFDECHRGIGNYAYVFLASRYKYEAINPLILGLTASPGGEEDKINAVCKNLFINEVVVKTEEDVDVKPYFKPIKIEWVKVNLGKKQMAIKSHLELVLKNRLKGLKNLGIIRSISKISKKDILQARGRVQNRISRDSHPNRDCLAAMSLLTAVFSLQHALELLETQGINNLHNYFQRLQKKKTKAAQGLFKNEDFIKAVHLTKNAHEEALEHPKIKKLLKILKKELKNGQQIIVFSQYRDTVNEIHRKCEENGIKSVKFFGQAAREKEKGLTQKEQKEIIKNFRKGLYQVLISTSVAEEGIDIPSVDLVILYEPVPSEIRMIQRRGRTGRKTEGRMIVLITKGTRDESYYYSSLQKERKMKNQLSKGLPQIETSLEIETPFNVENSQLSKKDSQHELIVSDNEEQTPIVTNNQDQTIIISDNRDQPQTVTNNQHQPQTVTNNQHQPPTVTNNLNQSPTVTNNLNQSPVIYVDHRESKSGVTRELSNLGVKIETTTLSVADYQVSSEVAVERKTSQDFTGSIIDKRLYKQAKDLVENFKNPIFIVEGENLYGSGLHPNAVRGALVSLAVDFGIPIIPTRSPEDTASMIYRLAVRENDKSTKEIALRTERKPLSLWEQQIFIIESLPNVGPVTARKLLEKFGTVKGVMNADKEELKQVDGIGDKIAQKITDVIDSVFKTSEFSLGTVPLRELTLSDGFKDLD